MLYKHDFLRGYLLLTAQPWGKVYRTDLTVGAEPSPAKIQGELYYRGVESLDAGLWVAICTTLSAGDYWPSLDTIHTTARALRPLPEPMVALPIGQEIMREEFGTGLYRAVALIGQLLANSSQSQYAGRKEQDAKGKVLTVTHTGIREALLKVLLTLSPAETSAVVTRYPFVASL